jgi:hypothetical protein
MILPTRWESCAARYTITATRSAATAAAAERLGQSRSQVSQYRTNNIAGECLVSRTLSQPRFWLVFGMEWPDHAAGPHAECAFAVAPSFIPKRVLPPSAYVIFDLANAFAAPGEQDVVMFSELTQMLRRNNADWPSVGVPDWEATVDGISAAPVPSLFLELSQYGHLMLCTAGRDNSYVYGPGGQQERIPESDLDNFRSSLRATLSRDWPDYIEGLERAGKIRPAP